MKIFNWMHRKLHSGNNYSQVSQDEDVEEKAVVETDTDALLLHDMLNGILTIGTLGHHHHLVPEAYFDSEELLGEVGEVIEEVEEAGLFEVAREASAAVRKESFKIKLSVEDEEKKIMEVVQVHEVQGSEKILELPLLKEHKEKRHRRRTTLADLLAANAVSDNDSAAKTVPDGTNVRGKQQAINAKNNMQHKKSKGDQKPPATTTTTGKLQTLIPRMLKKKIHPEMAEPKEDALKERNKAEKRPIAGEAASGNLPSL
ncbi:protein TILLER ANGLE CONTROL 1-like isoform X1 [Musa acuminata AAA Group]|uniref:protein TILLER ANGLE CONTROL 1-like isoform X1 n=1 Tax=Musa acuminata AAA Group TaxID=214697 RepID=UPI0031D6D3E2